MQVPQRLLLPALALLAVGLVGRAAAESPFLPGASAVVSGNASAETLEFAGINAMGDKTFVNVYDKALKKGRWVEVGGSDGTYSVLAFDPRHDQIVVKTGSIQKTLTLRKSTGTANGPKPVAMMPAAAGFAQPVDFQKVQPPPPGSADLVATGAVTPSPAATTPVEAAPAPKPETPAKPLTVARQEEEARMLVSDLLEIGMAQRKAYEEAQKKAAEGKTDQPAAAAPAPGG